MITLLVCAGCLVVGWTRINRHRDVRVPEVTDDEDCSPDDPLLNHDQQFSDTAPSTYNQIECPPNTSDEGSFVQAPCQPLFSEAPPPPPNTEDMSEQLSSITFVGRRRNPWPVSHPLPTSVDGMPTHPDYLSLWPEAPTANSNDECTWQHEDLTLVRRRSSPVNYPLASRSFAVNAAIPRPTHLTS